MTTGTVDHLTAHQAFRTGRLDRELLLARIRAGEFGAIQLAAGNSGGERWDDALHQAVESRYRLARTSVNGFFYTPR